MTTPTKEQNAKANKAYRARQRQRAMDLEAENKALKEKNSALQIELVQARAYGKVAWDTLGDLVDMLAEDGKKRVTQ